MHIRTHTQSFIQVDPKPIFKRRTLSLTCPTIPLKNH